MVTHSREQVDSRSARRLNEPRPSTVEVRDETPAAINRIPVAFVREEWRISDRWWTGDPIRRRYFDVVLETGENAVVFHDERTGIWYRQRA